jgi:hypothetical protein
VDAALTDFPVLIVTNRVNSSTDKKLAVTTSNGRRQCYVEVEKSTASNAILWTKVPSIASGSDTVLYLYFDPVVADNTQFVGDINSTAGANVWDSNFKLVYHMADDTTSTVLDSTSNSNDGTKKGANEPVEATGKIGKGQNIDNNDDYISRASTVSLQINGDITIEHWINADTLANTDAPVCKNWDREFETTIYANGRMGWVHGGAGGTEEIIVANVGTVTTGSFQYLATTRNTSTVKLEGFHNGVAQLNPSYTKVIDTSANVVYIGAQGAGVNTVDGILDEIRISNKVREDEWIKASYYSGMNTLIFHGSVEDREAIIVGPPAPKPSMPIGLAVLLQKWLEAKVAG